MSRNPQGEPRTAAGRAYLAKLGKGATAGAGDIRRNAILAIESEAAAPVEGLREALEPFIRSANGRTPGYHGDRRVYTLQINETTVERAAAALRAIESPAHPETGLDVERITNAIAALGKSDGRYLGPLERAQLIADSDERLRASKP